MENIKITAAYVKSAAETLGISDTGICTAAEDSELLSRLPSGITPFVNPSTQRIAPAKFLDGANSVIVCAFHYANPRPAEVNLSRYVWIADYHTVVLDYLKRLLSVLQAADAQTKGYIFTDSSPLCDKALAYKAGLGYFGKNSLLLHPRFGSLFFIGGIVTNLKLEPDSPISGDCGNCTACTQACPAHLCGTCQLDGYKCISYLHQKKGVLTAEEAELIRKSGSVWGCDLCQNVCPKNALQTQTLIPEFAMQDAFLPPDLTEEEFLAHYKNRAFHWRGYATLKRNLDILYK